MKVFGRRMNPVLMLVILGLGFYLWSLLNPDVLPGKPGDVYFYLWQAKWFCPNFFRGNFQVADFFWPGGVNMQGGYVAPLLYTLTCPIYSWGPRVVIKVIYGLQVITLMLVLVWTAGKYLKNDWLKISFILLYAFGGFYLVRIGEHVDLISTLWASALVYTVLDKLDVLKWKQMVVAAGMVALSFLSGWQNIANLTFLVVIVVVAKMKSWVWVKKHGRQLVINLGVGVVAFGVVFWPLAGPMVAYNLEKLRQAPPDDGVEMNMNLVQLVAPANELRRYFLPMLKQLNRRVGVLETTNPIDVVVIVIGAVGLGYELVKHKRRVRTDRLILWLVYFLIPFGENLSINGDKLIPLPYYQWLSMVPPLSITRAPARIGVVVVFLTTLWILEWVDKMLREKRKWGWLSKGVKVLTAYSVISTTMLANNVQIPTFNDRQLFPMKTLEEIKKAPASVKVLDVPLSIGVYSVPDYLQLVHGHPLMSGYVPYSTQTKETLVAIDSDPVLSQLECGGTTYKPTGKLVDEIPADEFMEAMKRDEVGYVIVHKVIIDYPECERVRGIIAGVVKDPRLKLLNTESDFGVYQLVGQLSEQEQRVISEISKD